MGVLVEALEDLFLFPLKPNYLSDRRVAPSAIQLRVLNQIPLSLLSVFVDRGAALFKNTSLVLLLVLEESLFVLSLRAGFSQRF